MGNRRWNKYAYLKVCFVLCGTLTALYLLYGLDFRRDHKDLVHLTLDKIERYKYQYPNEAYYVIPNVIAPSVQTVDPGNHDIIICTQTSLGNLHHISNLARKWDGLISIAVFSFGDEINFALHYITLMQKCFRNVRLNVRFHLVYPISKPPSNLTSSYENGFFYCQTLPLFRRSISVENYALGNISYPVNLLRNVALVHTTSAYVLNLDSDFIPSKGMKKDMETFLKTRKSSNKQKLAYVIPCFESNVIFYDPLSKQELLVAVKSGSVRQFTLQKCFDCHVTTNYSRWMSLAYPSAMNAAYSVKFRIPYEPFYIAERKQIPLFDARFKQYGFNRVSQVCEAYVSGFDFVVMNNAFVIHDGFKDPAKHYAWKEEENNKNRVIFNTVFKGDLKTKYPQSNRNC